MSAIVAAARGWIGTPYRHQQSVRGAGCDCLGLVRGVWREVCGPEPAQVPPYSRDWAEPQGEERLWRAAGLYLAERPKDAPTRPGDILLFRMRDRAVAKHLGIAAEISSGATFVHAYSGHGVVESRLTSPWARRIVARFAFPD
ncbi:NlpC/P60 family protein [Wenxinia marina]|uniref:Putative phage cell wall peptidase, NlpC/P60 family n=1 Tax=Wenxinia marina DSM 24838 TaxID=1123501 RepID=A0A0D0QFW6_9RHOB|nr:NlpC/P60 family protein [Wenxinia marina]KIQ69928.1 putative phage cell wall peptidase, NlpC/P60 family [Wenxinia marina DSM 24838]GGL62237.1 peptidase [Wenxinia marina]